MQHTFEIARRQRKTAIGIVTDIHSITYRLGRPYRVLRRHELPKKHEFENWETEEDLYFRKDGQIYNVAEFCTSGCRVIPGPQGGAQTASNGYFMIAGYNGKVYPVITEESRPYGMY